MVYRFTVHLTGYSRFSQPRKIAKQRPCIWMDSDTHRKMIDWGWQLLTLRLLSFSFLPLSFLQHFPSFFFTKFLQSWHIPWYPFPFLCFPWVDKEKVLSFTTFFLCCWLITVWFVADLWSPLPSLKVTPLLLLKDDNATLIRFCVWVLQIYQVAEVVEMHDAKWVIWGFVCLSFRKLNSSVVLHFSIVNGFVHGLLVGFGSLMSFWAPGC